MHCPDGHHPVFSRFTPTTYFYDFLGIKTRTCFLDTSEGLEINLLYPPPVNEEYFEWCDLLEAVIAADKSFTMIELGAGYGRWLVRAATALRQLKNIPYRLIGVEAEPQHFQWLLQHLTDNGIDPNSHLMINKAVNFNDGEVWFSVGEPEKHYGQNIVQSENYFNPSYPQQRAEKVPCLSLQSILKQHEFVDLIDLDIQGSEYHVLAVAIVEVCAKVKRIHIGTHGKAIEDNLRSLFSSLDWINVFDYSLGSTIETNLGTVTFGDGVQSWLNPSFNK
jgi:FkbM family methyltransferase